MLHSMTSRALLVTVRVAVLFAAVLGFSQEPANPWPESAILNPGDLAKALRSDAKKPAVICVAFPALYRSKHITGAVFAGPGNKPEGIEVEEGSGRNGERQRRRPLLRLLPDDQVPQHPPRVSGVEGDGLHARSGAQYSDQHGRRLVWAGLPDGGRKRRRSRAVRFNRPFSLKA
jgi:hypothetical protein